MSDDNMSIDGDSSDGVEIPGYGESPARRAEEVRKIEALERENRALKEELANVKEFVQKREEKEKKHKEALSAIQESIQKIQKTINDVLDASPPPSPGQLHSGPSDCSEGGVTSAPRISGNSEGMMEALQGRPMIFHLDQSTMKMDFEFGERSSIGAGAAPIEAPEGFKEALAKALQLKTALAKKISGTVKAEEALHAQPRAFRKGAAPSADVAAMRAKAQEDLRAQWSEKWGGIAGPTTASQGAPGALMALTEPSMTNGRNSEGSEDKEDVSEGEGASNPLVASGVDGVRMRARGLTFAEAIVKMEERLANDETVKEIYSDPKYGKKTCLWNPEKDRDAPQHVNQVPHSVNLIFRSWASIEGNDEEWPTARQWPCWKENQKKLKKEQDVQAAMGIIIVPIPKKTHNY